jgi:pyruvate dehydrogenase E1 component alpha subunit
MNLAALWRLPVLFCCENNLYAMGTALARSEAQRDLCLKAASYGVPAWPVDGMDALAVLAAARQAALAVRAGGGPAFLELRTYRFRAHSMFDPELYRDKAEVERWKERDPIRALVERLRRDDALDDAALAALERDADAEIAEAIAFAEAGTLEPVAELTRFVTSERSPA